MEKKALRDISLNTSGMQAKGRQWGENGHPQYQQCLETQDQPENFFQKMEKAALRDI